MKKFILILLAVCLLLGCVIGYAVSKNGAKGSGEPVALYDPEDVPAAQAETETPAPSAETAPDESAGSPQSRLRGDPRPARARRDRRQRERPRRELGRVFLLAA